MSESKNMSVQNVIDRLMTIEDKSQPFEVEVWNKDGSNLDYLEIKLTELTDAKNNDSLELGVYLEDNVMLVSDFENRIRQALRYCDTDGDAHSASDILRSLIND